MIYFLQPIDGGPIKIGTTEDVDRRHGQLEAHYRRPLALLASLDGGRDEERAIHERFAHLRIGRTEQFRPAPELMAFIGRPLLVNPDPDTVEVMPAYTAGGQVRISVEAMRWARAVAGLTGESVSGYISRIIMEHAPADFERRTAELLSECRPSED